MYKRIVTIAAAILITAIVWAQAPEKMSYQAVVRDASNNLTTNQAVGMQISILQDSSTGTAVYVETQTPSTNANGLVSLEIGTGTVITGTFAGINWANGPYFIKTETDPRGGTAYAIAGTNELMSVPYALFSANETPGATGANGTNGIDGAVGATGSVGATGATGTNVGVSGFAHYLGEAFNGGIIYYLYKGSDSLEHGLIVALTESRASWQTIATLVNANRTEDGAYNTPLMTGSLASQYISSLGAGWYLPSIDELGLLYYNRYSAQKGLRTGGNTLLSYKDNYWSSTEDNATNARVFAFTIAWADSWSKTIDFTVRGVRAF
ncbi:MAG: hypothetical protein ACJAZ3_001809 [Sphingobacteriales bacterium]|jgi:hypothetical protein